MASKILNIGITDKITQFTVTNSKPRKDNKIHTCFMISTPDGAVNDGQIVDITKLANALKEQFEEKSLKLKKVNFTLNSGKIAAREVRLPLVRENKIKSIVETNAAEYFPIDMTKYHVAYSLLERVEDPAKQYCRVMVYATPITLIEGYFKLAAELGLEIVTLDFEGNCVYEAAKRQAEENVSTLFVDIGTTTSFTSVMRGKLLLMSRSIQCGCDELIAAHIASKRDDDVDYCKALSELVTSDPCVRISLSEQAEYLSRAISNIERFEDYFNSSFSETPIEKIVITGVCCKIPTLLTMISEAVGINATIAENVPDFSAHSKLSEFPPVYISCLANIFAPLDLIPPEFAKKKKERDPNSLSLSICVLCAGAIIGLALSASAFIDYLFAMNDKEILEREIGSLEYTEPIYLKYSDYVLSAKGFTNLKELTASKNDDLAAFIAELEKKMPSDISVLSATCYETGVNLNIVVTSKESAATVISQLRTFKSISVISVSSLTQTNSDDGLVQVYFSVSCTYGVNPYYPEISEG